MKTYRDLGTPKNYLAYAGVAPPSLPVKEAVSAAVDTYSRLGGGAFAVLAAQREHLRADVATLLGTAPENIAFVAGTTVGLREIALSIRWRPGDRIVLFSGEFPANVTPWQRVAELFGLEVRFISLEGAVEDPDVVLDKLERELKDGVRLVAVSAVQFQTGLRLPLGALSALCKRYGSELAVDAIQACGVIPLNVEALGIDYLACGAHKWLMGLEGAGFVYVAPARAATLEPRTAGWLSHEDSVRFLMEGPGHLRYDRAFRQGVQVLEGSSMNAVGLAALAASLRGILDAGPAKVFDHVSAYLDQLDAGIEARGLTSLRTRDPRYRSGILSFVPPAGLTAARIAAALAARGVHVSTPDGLVRFAPHYPNPHAEVSDVLGALDEALARP